MKADLTRNTFHSWKHFTRVLMQQGRVQLDADWNEQAAILAYYLRGLAKDVIGPCGGPLENLGFQILPLTIPGNTNSYDFAIAHGHFYVDGVLCANDHEFASFPPPSPMPTGNSVTVTPDRWILDGAPFRVGDYLEFFDAFGFAASAFAIVTKTAASSFSLTVTIDPNLFANLTKGGATRIRRLLIFSRQPDCPGANSNPAAGSNEYLVYLDAWEGLVTYVQDDSIREVALGGPDTAARAKLLRQVKWVTPIPQGQGQPDELTSVVGSLENQFQPRNRGLLKARVTPTAASTNPCIISPTSNYRGPENQLYRVQIHTGSKNLDGSAATATFTWSRENGAVVFPVLAGGGTSVMTLATLGRDDRFGLAENDWVEVEDDDYVLTNKAGTLLQVLSIDRTTMQVTLSGSPDAKVGNDPKKHPLLRRWDQKPVLPAAGAQRSPAGGVLTTGTDNAPVITPGVWLDLEDGVQILFFEPDTTKPIASYRTGDYWLIPARVATGSVEWPTVVITDDQGNNPTTDQVPLAPVGIMHHYAPLARVTVDATGTVKVDTPNPPNFTELVKANWP